MNGRLIQIIRTEPHVLPAENAVESVLIRASHEKTRIQEPHVAAVAGTLFSVVFQVYGWGFFSGFLVETIVSC